MLRNRDGTLLPEAEARPLLAGDHRHRQPVHRDGEVVDAPQEDVGGHLAAFHGAQKMLRPRLQEGEAAEVVQALVLRGDQPAHLGDAVLELHQFVHDILPASLADLRIADEEVGAGDLEVDDRLLMRLVAGVEEAFGDRAVLGLERFLAPGVVVLAPEDLPPAEHAVFRFHDSCRRV